MTKNELINYLGELGLEYQIRFNNYNDMLKDKIINTINELCDNENIDNPESEIHFGNPPLGDMLTAKYLILGTCPGNDTLHANIFLRESGYTPVYYCSDKNSFWELMLKIFPLWKELVQEIIIQKKAFCGYKMDGNNANQLLRNQEFQSILIELSKLQKSFCEYTGVCFRDGVELFLGKGSTDGDRAPILYNSLININDKIIIRNGGKIWNIRDYQGEQYKREDLLQGLDLTENDDILNWVNSLNEIIEMVKGVRDNGELGENPIEIPVGELLGGNQEILRHYQDYKNSYLRGYGELYKYRFLNKVGNESKDSPYFEKWGYIKESKNTLFICPSTSNSKNGYISIRESTWRRAFFKL